MTYADKPISYLIAHAWGIRATCRDCAREVFIGASKLASLPPEALVRDVCQRLTCAPPEGCGSSDIETIVLNDKSEASRRNLEQFERDVATGRK